MAKTRRAIKIAVQDCWATTKDQKSLTEALKTRGLTLAKGDRGGVIIDEHCEIYSLARQANTKVKEVRARLTELDSLPPAAEARASIAKTMAARLERLKATQATRIDQRRQEIIEKRKALVQAQRAERAALKARHAQRLEQERAVRQARYSRGIKGLIDRVSGKHRLIKQGNELELLKNHERDRSEKDTLIFSHLEARRGLTQRRTRLENFKETKSQTMNRDISQFKEIMQGKRETFERSVGIHRSSSQPSR